MGLLDHTQGMVDLIKSKLSQNDSNMRQNKTPKIQKKELKIVIVYDNDLNLIIHGKAG